MKYKKLSLILAGMMLLNSTVPVFADDDTETVASPGTHDVEVSATIPETYSVTVPKKLVLNEHGQADYEVKVNGDISGASVISVVPNETFTLTQVNKDPVDVSVTQEKTIWSCTEMGTSGVGTLSAERTEGAEGTEGTLKLTAGNWSGSFNFTISKLEVSQTLEPGAYAANGRQLATWDELGFDVTVDGYYDDDYELVGNKTDKVIIL